MTAEDRAKIVLEYMAEKEVAMSTGLWYENLKLDRSITFSQDTVRRRLHDFNEVGWVERLDIDQGVFRINDSGRRVVENDFLDAKLDDVIGISDE